MAKSQRHEKLSYQKQLSSADKAIYLQKLVAIDGVDPCDLTESSFESDPSIFPDISYADIVNYLVFSPNPAFSLEQMKAYKGLEAHNQFTSGWVRNVGVLYHTKSRAIISGRVSVLLLLFKN